MKIQLWKDKFRYFRNLYSGRFEIVRGLMVVYGQDWVAWSEHWGGDGLAYHCTLDLPEVCDRVECGRWETVGYRDSTEERFVALNPAHSGFLVQGICDAIWDSVDLIPEILTDYEIRLIDHLARLGSRVLIDQQWIVWIGKERTGLQVPESVNGILQNINLVQLARLRVDRTLYSARLNGERIVLGHGFAMEVAK